jgi:hypothetical protein
MKILMATISPERIGIFVSFCLSVHVQPQRIIQDVRKAVAWVTREIAL